MVLYREEEGGKITEKVYNALSIHGLPPIRLVFMGNEHYDCVYQRGWRKKAGFCQGTRRRTCWGGGGGGVTVSRVTRTAVKRGPLGNCTLGHVTCGIGQLVVGQIWLFWCCNQQKELVV